MTLLRESDFTDDLAASSASPVLMAVNDAFYGRVGAAGDKDWIAVDLVAGQTYKFAMVGIGATPVKDPYLRIIAADGVTELASADDTLPNKNALLSYTASQTGRVYVAAGHFRDTATSGDTRTGDYGLTISADAKPSFSLDMIAGVISYHTPWAVTGPEGVTLTYGFREASTKAGFQPFTAAQITGTEGVLNFYSEIANLHFVKTAGDTATLLYANYSANDGFGAYGITPGDTAASSGAGDYWNNDATPPTSNTGFGSGFYATTLHEIGHTMGISHPGLYNAALGISHTYAQHAQFAQDSNTMTVMSYFGSDDTGDSDLTADTLMIADILAMQNYYGANMTTRAGNSIYGFGANTGDVYDFAINGTPKLAIWDAGGIDLLDASRSYADQRIDLADGSLSDILGFRNNVGIAKGVILENATGGYGADRISGNGADNLLTGGGGDDTLSGLEGDDTLIGGGGADRLMGGAGNDVLDARSTGATAPQTLQMVNTASVTGQGRLTSASVELYRSESFTIEMLWKQNSTTSEYYQVNFGKLAIYQYASGLAAIQIWGADAGQGWHYGAIDPMLADGALHRLSITYDDATGLMQVFIDGARTNTWEHPAGAFNLLGNGKVDITEDAAFGDIRIWNGVRSATQIFDNAAVSLTNPLAEADLVQYWVGNGTGAMVSANGRVNLTATGTTATSAALWSQGQDDTLAGGAGDDSYFIDSGNDTLIEGADGGTDTVHSSVGMALGAHFENLVGQGAVGLRLTGNSAANQITGTQGADTLDGGSGVDTLNGGLGDDVYFVDQATDTVIDTGGNDIVYTTANYTLGAGVERLTAQSDAGLALTGNQSANWITGGAGADTLTGGADSLSGGAGDDLYILTSLGSTLFESVNGGFDRVRTGFDFTFIDNIEAVEFTAARRGTGNAGNNIFYSGAGNDTLIGGAGDDVYHLTSAGDIVTELAGGGTDTVHVDFNYTMRAYVENLYVTGSAGVAIRGNTSNNILFSGAGDDTLNGLSGNDIYHVNSVGDVVVDTTGTDTIFTTVNYTLTEGLAIETLRVEGAAGLALTGNALNTTIIGGLGDDTLRGGGGVDRLSGGAGNDLYILSSGADTVLEGTAGGTDTVQVSFAYRLGANMENLRVTAEVGVVVQGNAANNIMTSGLGADTLDGGAGNDCYYLNDAGDVVLDAGGVDTIFAAGNYALGAGLGIEYLHANAAAAIALTGNELGNRIYSGGFGDTITGGAGADVIYGGNDAACDVFVFATVSDSTTAARDTLYEFVSGLDRIDLTAIDANATLAGDQAFAGLRAVATANALWTAVSGANLYLRGDVTGDKTADFEVLLRGITHLVAADILM